MHCRCLINGVLPSLHVTPLLLTLASLSFSLKGFRTGPLIQQFSKCKCSPWTSISVTWGHAGNASFRAQPGPTESETREIPRPPREWLPRLPSLLVPDGSSHQHHLPHILESLELFWGGRKNKKEDQLSVHRNLFEKFLLLRMGCERL